MRLERYFGEGDNEALLCLEVAKVREKNNRENVNKRIKRGIFAGIGLATFTGAYIFLKNNPEYVAYIMNTARNLFDRFYY